MTEADVEQIVQRDAQSGLLLAPRPGYAGWAQAECERDMTPAGLLLSALLAGTEAGNAAAHPAPVQTIDMATLTPLTARPGPGRFVGLLCSKSQGKLPVVWLHVPTATPWAVLHTVRRHGGRVEGVIVLELDVPRRWLRRNRRGLWCAPRDVPPDRIKRVIDFGELAASPVDTPAA
jgi:hypothetical protein